MKIGVTLALALLAAGAACAGVAVASAAGFSPQAVFALPDRHYIDDRCKGARAFADRAAEDYSKVDAPAAAEAERAFIACVKLPRLNPDVDQQRYLVLAAAAAAFIVGGKTSGDGAEEAYRFADRLASQLGGSPPLLAGAKHPDAGEAPPPAGSSAMSGGGSSGEGDEGDEPTGRAHAPLKFSDVATRLRQAVADALADAHAPAKTST